MRLNDKGCDPIVSVIMCSENQAIGGRILGTTMLVWNFSINIDLWALLRIVLLSGQFFVKLF